jgi:hypothetical protein
VRSALRGRGWLIAVVLLGLAIVAGSLQGGEDGREPSRSSFDEGSLGFAAWAELLRRSGAEVTELQRPPSSGGLDPETTVVALDIGDPTDEDVQALSTFVEEGGYLIAGGETDRDAVERMTGISPELGGADSGPQLPLLQVPQTESVAEVDPAGGPVYSDAAGGLPALGSSSGDLLLLSAPSATGSSAVLASSDALTNDAIPSADNAQFGLDLAQAGGPTRPVIFLQSLARSEGQEEGLAALPAAWTAGFAGLLLAGLVLIASRLRRLGPPDGEGAARAEPRSGYVDAMARNLARRGQIPAATEPVRRAALDGIARRSGARPEEGDEAMLAARAEAAGVPPDEAEALAGPLDSPEAAIKATRALARMRR